MSSRVALAWAVTVLGWLGNPAWTVAQVGIPRTDFRRNNTAILGTVDKTRVMVGTREAADSLVDTAAIRVHLTDRLHAAGLRILPRHDIKRFYYLIAIVRLRGVGEVLEHRSRAILRVCVPLGPYSLPAAPAAYPHGMGLVQRTQWDTIARGALDSTVQAKVDSLTTAFLRDYRAAKETPLRAVVE